jgi:hypothetical protein
MRLGGIELKPQMTQMHADHTQEAARAKWVAPNHPLLFHLRNLRHLRFHL